MKWNIFIYLPITLTVFTMFPGCTESEEPASITIFAAASTTDLINEIAYMFEEDMGIDVKINTASSGTLARQIEQGAEADIYISASAKWMNYTGSLGIVREKQAFLRNRLVLISHIDSTIETFKLTADSNLPFLFTSRLSMGDPAHVPAGQYAFEALNNLGWYEDLEDRILPGADVRAALSVIEFDEAQLGIVYETDALKSEKVKIISYFPEKTHSPVLYFCALISPGNSQGEAFYKFITTSKRVQDLCRRYGFTPLEN